MEKVAIALAPVDYADADAFPTAKELAEDICGCYDAGASVVHYHVTDERGKASADPAYFMEVLDRVKSRCDIIVEGSTGGAGVAQEIRTVALEVPGVELASLNMGSCNLFGKVYENPPDEIQRIGSLMKQKGIIPDMCFFEPGFVEALADLRAKGIVGPPFVAGVCLGFPGPLPASVENLAFMVGKLPPETIWVLVHHGFRDYSLLAAAIAAGGHVRVGFEDSRHLGGGQKATSNRELVDKARQLVLQLGREPISAAELRPLLGIRAAGGGG